MNSSIGLKERSSRPLRVLHTAKPFGNIVFIHAGHNHALSASCLKTLSQAGLPEITPIEVCNNKLKQWLVHNSKGLKIKYLPVFILTLSNGQTIVYPPRYIDDIIKIIRQLRLSTMG